MSFQRKLWRLDINKEFWEDPDKSISYLMRDLLLGRDVSRIATALKKAGIQKVSDSLLYKQANPGEDARPSLKQFLLEIKITENCDPLMALSRACGTASAPYSGDLMEDMRQFMAEWEALDRKVKGVSND